MADDREDRARFTARFREDLLAHAPHWAEPLRMDGRRRAPAAGPGWHAVPVLVVLAAIALLLSPFLARPRVMSGAHAMRRAWPAGFNGRAHLTVSQGLLILFEGHRVAVFRTDALTRPLWRQMLPSAARILDVWTSPSGRTLLAVRYPHRLEAVLLGPSGRPEETTVLAPTVRVAAAPSKGGHRRLPVPRHAVWIRPGPNGGFVLSDRALTYVLSAKDRVLSLVEGGSGSLLMTNAAGSLVVVSYTPDRYTLFVSTLAGSLIYKWAEPMPAFPSLTHGAHLVPIRYGSGVILETNHSLLTLSQAGLNATFASPRGPTSGDAHLVNTPRGTRLVVWGASLGLRLPLLAGYRGLAVLDTNGVIVAARQGTLYALRPDGRILATASGEPGSVAVGTRYAFVATADGFVRLGPFAPPRLPIKLSWAGAAGPWHVTAAVRPLSFYAPYLATVHDVVAGPVGGSYASTYQSTGYLFPGASMAAADPGLVFPEPVPRPLAARVVVTYTGRDPAQFHGMGSSSPPWWGYGPQIPGYRTGTEPAEFSQQGLRWPHARPGFTRTYYMADNPLAWMVMAAGWAPLPRQFSWHLSYRVKGHRQREHIAVMLTAERPAD